MNLGKNNSVKNKIKFQFIKIFGAGSIFKNMSVLASSSIITKIIGFAAYPIITRVYSPADFGVLAVFSATLFILLPISTLRYSLGIPLPQNDDLAFNLFVLGVIIAVIFSSILGIFFITTENYIFELFNIPEISEYWWLLILGIIGAAVYELSTNWATRKVNFGPVAKSDILRSSILAITQILLGLLGYRPFGLVIGETVHKFGGSLFLARYYINDFIKNKSVLSLKSQFYLFKYYRTFPLYNMPSDLLLIFTTKVPLLYFAYQFGPEYSGQLGLSIMIISVPLRLFGRTTAQAYYAEISKIGIKEKEQVYIVTKSIIKILLTISLVVFSILLFSPSLFAFVFGSEWIQSGEFTRILSVYLLLEFVTTPLIYIYVLFDKQSKYLILSIIRTVLVLGSFYISYSQNYTSYETLYVYTGFLSFYFVLLGYSLHKIIK